MGYWDKFEKVQPVNDYWQRFEKVQPAEEPAFSLKPLTTQEREKAAALAKVQRPQRSLGEKVSSFMVTNPASRVLGMGLQGISNASLNPAGYVARAAGLNTSPLSPQNAVERGIEKGAQYGYDMAVLGTMGNGAGAAGLLGSGKSALSIGAQALLAPGKLYPAVTAAAGGGFAEGLINPKTSAGKLAANIIGGSPLMPLRAAIGTAKLTGKSLAKTLPVLSGVSETSYQKAFDIGKAEQIAKNKIKNLTTDEKSGILPFVKNRRNINDILNEESSRLACQNSRKAVVEDVRMDYLAHPGHQLLESGRPFADARRASYGPEISGIGRGNDAFMGGVSGQGRQSSVVWQPSEPLRTKYQEAGFPALSFAEYPKGTESAKSFYNAITNAKKGLGAKGAQVYVYPKKEYGNMRTFLSEDRKTGFALKDDGDIVSVFSAAETPKNTADSIIEAAVSAGGKKLDAYDTFLPEIYSRHGFREVDRDVWNEQFAPRDWNKRAMKRFNLGEPDVVYMEYDPTYFGGYMAPNSLQNVVNRLNADVAAGQSLRRSMNGEKSVRSIVDDANQALRNIKDKAVQDYQKQRNILFDNQTKLDINDILDSVRRNSEKLTFDGIPVAGKDTQSKAKDMFDAVNRFQNKNTMAGLDAMKRAVQGINVVNDDLARNIQTDLVNTIKGTVRKQDAGYSDLLDGYSGAMEAITDLKNSLNVGSKNKETTARSILQALRDNVNTNFGNKYDFLQQLERQGGKELISALVGQEFRSPIPRGLSKLVGGLGALTGFTVNPAALAALPLSSPRLTGSAAYHLGRGAGVLNPYTRLIPKQRYYDIPYYLMQRANDN